MKYLEVIIIFLVATKTTNGMVTYNLDKNISDVAIALSEIINGLNPTQLAILAEQRRHYDYNEVQNIESDNIQRDVDDFIYQLHKLYFKSVIYYDVELFFQYIEANLLGSIESVNLIFCEPYELSRRIQERKLSHRLSLFIFFWGATHPPKPSEVFFGEPMRAVVITRPRTKAFRIYYNQAIPNGNGDLKLVNWYDAENLGLQKVPLLPSAASVYSNFQGRVFRVPVFHSPPWFWVDYSNDTANNFNATFEDNLLGFDDEYEYEEVNVTGGRDHRLLLLLSLHMNFDFVYIDAPGRTQGSLPTDGEGNESFTGGIGLLQNGLADFLLGDISLSWERRKAVEFSFFTLADSGAFATHAPRRLNEAFAIIRPFKMDVWPYLILTIIFSGPIFYAIIAIPYKWQVKRINPADKDVEKVGELTFYMAYIKEITIDTEATRKLLRQQNLELGLELGNSGAEASEGVPKNLLDRCIWFTVQLFLKQSCQGIYHGYRAKLLIIVYWIGATYVLADVYSAQLTSQFARPAHEAPINTLHRLQNAMIERGYQLYVEKESSSLEMLENGTEIFQHLYALMKQQNPNEEGYLIDSVEAGIKLIADGLENKAVLGGRETLYFNIQQFGSKTFQLSQKLYTRYSAVAVKIGCPFLDSLNDVLIRLFEGGIIDKMTNAEYSIQSRLIGKEIKEQRQNGNGETETSTGTTDVSNSDQSNGKGAEDSGKDKQSQDTQVIQPLNLRMLQGAFIILLVGYVAAGIIVLMELLLPHLSCCGFTECKTDLGKYYRWGLRTFWRITRRTMTKLLH